MGQVHLKGIVQDSASLKPVEFASVYVNGTTNGVISNKKGEFTLNDFKTPCKVVVSHVSYNTVSFELKREPAEDTVIFMKLKDIEIQEVSLLKRNSRKKNLKLFEKSFLGNDKWGKRAFIENENVLNFNWEFDTIQANQNESKLSFYNYYDILKYIDRDIIISEDDSIIRYMVPIKFIVKAKEPLNIQLPLLGYFLQYDLQDFEMEFEYENDFVMWKYLGNSYYQSIETKSKSLKDKISKNRQDAYFNSPQHINKAIYTNTLRKNGYVVSKMTYDSLRDEMYAKELIPDENWKFKKDKLFITGYKNKEYLIKYYSNIKGKPINKLYNKSRNYLASNMKFLSDTCIITSNGTNPDNSILYLPFIGTKQIGATLPFDYNPKVKD